MVSSRGGLFEIYLNEIGAFWKQFTSRHTVNILRKKNFAEATIENFFRR